MTTPAEKWTPEPWFTRTGDDWISIGTADPDEALIADMLGDERADSCKEANADRIVACVNALAGIPDPQAMRAEYDALKVRLEAIEARYKAISDRHWTCMGCGQSWNCDKADTHTINGNSTPTVECPYCEAHTMRTRLDAAIRAAELYRDIEKLGCVGGEARIRAEADRLLTIARGQEKPS